MDAELKAKWVAALRSGEYQQCRDELTANGAFCCIGVGYEAVLGKSAESLTGDPNGATEVAAKALGLSRSQREALVSLNDGTSQKRPKKFPEIADYIEKHL